MISPRRDRFQFPFRRQLSRFGVIVALVAVTLAPSVASAQEYPPTPTLLVSEAIVTEGGIVTLTGVGFLPDSPVEIYLTSGPVPVSTPEGQIPIADFAVVGTAQANGTGQRAFAAELVQAPTPATLGTLLGTVMSDSEGSFTFQWDTAGYPPGKYILTATDGTNTASTEVIIVAAGDQAVVVPIRPDTGPTPTAVSRTLPLTGGVSGFVLRFGIVLLTIGGLAILASRGRWRTLLPNR